MYISDVCVLYNCGLWMHDIHSNQSMNDGRERFDIDYVLLYSTMNVKMGSSGSFIVDDFRLR